MSAAKDRLKVLVADDSAVYRKLVEQAFAKPISLSYLREAAAKPSSFSPSTRPPS
jgi:hypothetical protein